MNICSHKGAVARGSQTKSINVTFQSFEFYYAVSKLCPIDKSYDCDLSRLQLQDALSLFLSL